MWDPLDRETYLGRGNTSKNYPKKVSKLDEERAKRIQQKNSWGMDRDLMNRLDKEFDIAISSDGKERLLGYLHNVLVDNVEDLLNADKEVKAIIDAAWSGEDKDQFIENFEKAKSAALTRIEKNYNDLVAELNRVEEEWTNFRSSHVKAD